MALAAARGAALVKHPIPRLITLTGSVRAGKEIFHIPGRPPMALPHRSPTLYFIQRLRDEAHRFAITYHRLLRDRKTTNSALDLIPGIGRVKKLALLHHFPSVDHIRNAGATKQPQHPASPPTPTQTCGAAPHRTTVAPMTTPAPLRQRRRLTPRAWRKPTCTPNPHAVRPCTHGVLTTHHRH